MKESFSDPTGQWEKDKAELHNMATREKKKEEEAAAAADNTDKADGNKVEAAPAANQVSDDNANVNVGAGRTKEKVVAEVDEELGGGKAVKA